MVWQAPAISSFFWANNSESEYSQLSLAVGQYVTIHIMIVTMFLVMAYQLQTIPAFLRSKIHRTVHIQQLQAQFTKT